MAKVQTWIERVQFQIELVNIFQELAESKPEAYPKSKGRMNKHILKKQYDYRWCISPASSALKGK